MGQYKTIDLFAGCGGLSLGLQRAGFRLLAAIEGDSLAARTYAYNFPRTYIINKNIQDVDPKYVMQRLHLKAGELDLLAGCPPCQGFSSIRTLNGRRKVNEPRNELLFDFLRFVEAFRPKTIMFENVPGLIRERKFDRFCGSLSKFGYFYLHDVFDAAEYGVPQRRKRLILTASAFGPIESPRPTRRRKYVRDAISHLKKPGRGSDSLHDYKENRLDRIVSLIKLIPHNGGDRQSLPLRKQLSCHRRTDGFRDVYGRMSWDIPAPTMTGGCINPSKGRFIHPTQNRAITLREAALLQGFPKSYFFSLEEGRYRAAEMIGNAFPPEFARRHAHMILRHLQSVECGVRE